MEDGKGGKLYYMSGVPVRFPYEAYRSQVAMMLHTVRAAQNSSHALLESPTGTGKSLALLCAALAWKEKYVKEWMEREKKKCKEERERMCWELEEIENDCSQGMEQEFFEYSGDRDGGKTEQGGVGNSDEDWKKSRCSLQRERIAKDSNFQERKQNFVKKREPSHSAEKGEKASSAGPVPIINLDSDDDSEKAPPTASAPIVDLDSDDDFAPSPNFRDTSWQKPKKRRRSESNQNSELSQLPTQLLPSEVLDSTDGDDGSDDGNLPRPRIFYASRTHSQLTHIVSELRKTSYRPRMTILASRKEYCVNPAIRPLAYRDEACRASVLAQACPYSPTENLRYVSPPTSQPWDIEELVKRGKDHCNCPYYHALHLYKDADLILAPYNYLIDPAVRRARNISLRNCIIILDEAHNIETHAREAASFTSNLADLHATRRRVALLSCENLKVKNGAEEKAENDDLQETPSGEREREGQVVAGLMGMFAEWVDGVLERNELICKDQKEERAWEGQALQDILQNAGVTLGYIAEAREALGKLKAAELEGRDLEDSVESWCADGQNTSAVSLVGRKGRKLTHRFHGGRHRRARVVQVDISGSLEDTGTQRKGLRIAAELIGALEFCLNNPEDYVLAVERECHNWSVLVTVHLWCMNAAVPLGEIANTARTIIVTSGTLSPLGAFAAELGFPFGILKSFPVNIVFPESLSQSVASQQSTRGGQENCTNQRLRVFASIVGYGKEGTRLEASWRKAGLFDFQDAIGLVLIDYCQVVYGGVLVFFPSYGMMEKLIGRWKLNGTWEKLEEVNRGALCVERKGQNETDNYVDGIKSNGKGLMFAVCRGKVSEGVDFRDEEARAVVMIGIPFPNVGSMQVVQKKIWNDYHGREPQGIVSSTEPATPSSARPTTKKVLSGNEWYRLQAFRALNQAIGRCLRHRDDYGAVLLLDMRFRRPENVALLPAWTRAALRSFPQLYTHENTLRGLRHFFEQTKGLRALRTPQIQQASRLSRTSLHSFSQPQEMSC